MALRVDPWTVAQAEKWQWVPEFWDATDFEYTKYDRSKFRAYCIERMWMGRYRYGLFEYIDPSQKNICSIIKSIKLRIKYYGETRNLEMLCDAFNLVMILFFLASVHPEDYRGTEIGYHSKKALISHGMFFVREFCNPTYPDTHFSPVHDNGRDKFSVKGMFR